MRSYSVLSLIPHGDAARDTLSGSAHLKVTEAVDVEQAIEEMQRAPYDIIISHQSLSPADLNKLNKMRLNLLPESEFLEYYSVNARHFASDLQLQIEKIEKRRSGPKFRFFDDPGLH